MIWLWVKTHGIPCWLVGEFTTNFAPYFSGWIESDVHWGVFHGLLTHGHRDRLSTEYANLLKSVLVDRRFGAALRFGASAAETTCMDYGQ